MTTNNTTVPTMGTGYICIITVTQGIRKGWNRHFLLPQDLPIDNLETLLVTIFPTHAEDSALESAKLLAPFILYGKQCQSLIEVLPCFHNQEKKCTLKDLDAISDPPGLQLAMDIWREDRGYGKNKTTYKFDFYASTIAAHGGKITCLGGTNVDDGDTKTEVYDRF